ncbi:MAG: long-chain-fatty-acid--CoA ligase [Gammaproteobacteria bacterium]|nr:long-chain-fatty-acid--CoA ligase [Gammaproteobacteria bacterium]
MQNNIGLFLTKRAHTNPDLEAIVDHATARRFTYAECNGRANQIARAVQDKGISKGDRVALLAMNGPEFVETFFGLAKLGVVVVPLNWRLVAHELAYILKNSGASMLIYSGEFKQSVANLYDMPPGETNISHWVEIGDAQTRHIFAEPYEELLSAQHADELPINASDDDLLFIMYTSGTTGLPKGAVHTHKTMLWAILTFSAGAELRFRDRYALALPLFHVGALLPLMVNVYCGITNVLLRQFNAQVMWETIEHERITVTLAVPSMLNFMLEVPNVQNYDYSSLRWAISGATPVPVTLIERFAEIGIEIHQAYGLTESGGPGCIISPDDALKRIGSTGKAFFFTEVRVVDGAGQSVQPGEPGEVLIKGQHIMKEYWNNPEATAETIRDGWLYTGDVALVDEDGFITIHDRVKDMVISGGENVYPAEIENTLLSHPSVVEAAVIGQPSERWGESPFAIVVRRDETLSEAALLQYCAEKLARFKLPKGVGFVEEIPRNPTGKALKRILRERFPGPAKE